MPKRYTHKKQQKKRCLQCWWKQKCHSGLIIWIPRTAFSVRSSSSSRIRGACDFFFRFVLRAITHRAQHASQLCVMYTRLRGACHDRERVHNAHSPCKSIVYAPCLQSEFRSNWRSLLNASIQNESLPAFSDEHKKLQFYFYFFHFISIANLEASHRFRTITHISLRRTRCSLALHIYIYTLRHQVQVQSHTSCNLYSFVSQLNISTNFLIIAKIKWKPSIICS